MTFSNNILDRRHPQVTLQQEEELQLTKFLINRAKPILTNLLKNAIKYSPLGSTVDLALECRGGEVIFQIKDRGIGIPSAEQQRLFEPFHRGGNVGDIPGSGLGLAVVKKLVDVHGGEITVASVVGVGTTFTIALPLGQLVEAEASTRSLILETG